ncbi:MAG: hypothetical protein ACREAU_01320 [Nitrosopumilaceae archaeon]
MKQDTIIIPQALWHDICMILQHAGNTFDDDPANFTSVVGSLSRRVLRDCESIKQDIPR